MDAAPPPIPPPVLEALGFHLLAAKYFMIASFVMLVYDIVITTDQEIDRIWSRKFTGATWLYLMNRYLPPLEYILVIAAFQVPALSEDVLCGRIVRFAGASTQITVAVIGLIMMLRTYALYGRNNYILGGLAALWLAEQAIMAYALTHSVRVPLPPGFVGCILTAEPNFELLTSFFWICPVIFETTVFALTLGRTIVLARRQVRLPLLTLILRDGIGYFAVIVAVNIANILLFLTQAADLQAINASFSQLLPSLLMSRLVLNLKDEEAGKPKVTQRNVYATGLKSEQESHSFFTAAIGILGGHVGSNTGPEPSARSYELQSPPVGGTYKSFMPSMPNSRVPMPYADSWSPPSPSLKVPLTGDRRV